jgi:hypothetical protein
MKKLIVLVFGSLLLGGAGCHRPVESQSAQKVVSPKLIYLPHDGPGTGDGFACEVIYEISGHESYKGVKHAVVVSKAGGLEGVEIWSPIPNLQNLPIGTRFYLKGSGGEWEQAFRLLPKD